MWCRGGRSPGTRCAPYKEQVEEITKRLIDVSNGAALMTGTTVMELALSGEEQGQLDGAVKKIHSLLQSIRN